MATPTHGELREAFFGSYSPDHSTMGNAPASANGTGPRGQDSDGESWTETPVEAQGEWSRGSGLDRDKPPARRRLPVVGGVCLLIAVLFASFLLLRGSPPPRTFVKPIAKIAVGDQVAVDPDRSESDSSLGATVEPRSWRRLEIRATKTDGGVSDVTLLRPLWWLDRHDAKPGGVIHVSVPECGIDGEAEIVSIGPCPPIRELGGRTVTGVFRHRSADVIDVSIARLDQPIGTTANHPFWSEDRREFVRADSLRIGERLRTRDGKTPHVTALQPRLRAERVYNIEVQGAHVYHVAHDGVLVHNGNLVFDLADLILGDCPKHPSRSFTPKHGHAANSAVGGRDALIAANRARSAALREQHADILGAWQRYKNRGGDLSLPAWKKKYDVLQGNRARGRWAESFGEPGQVYNTPYGRRIVDNAPAIEIKSGYASRTKFIRWQIVKDMWLRRNVPGYNPVWRFVDEAPTEPLLRHLETMGIPYQLPGQF